MTISETAGTATRANKIMLKGMLRDELKEFFGSIGEKPYRADQAFNWIYNYRVESFGAMMNMSKELRAKLDETAELNTLTLEQKQVSAIDGAAKLLFKTNGGNLIESVILPDKSRVTLCVSTQVGCPLDCKFCATGLMGYKRNLHSGEIFDQYAIAQRIYERPITNIVFMGMGEPLLNFEQTVKTLRIFSDELNKGISHKKITVSTAGIPNKIIELADTGLKSKLAFSLHSCFEDRREMIMPINKKYSLKENLEAIEYFSRKTDTWITFEYVMLKGINDRAEDIKALVKLCRRIKSKVNIIPFNSLEHMNPDGISAELQPTTREKIDKFADKLREQNISVFLRNTQGEDIDAACGQLAIKY